MKRFTLITLCLLALASCAQKPLEITRTQLKDKIAGAWLGQMVGNIYGLEYENKFVDEPGEGPFVFNKAITKMTAVDGAFSDDDTDVEYLYLMMMEKYGLDITYAQVKEGWMYHIRDRVWLANRAALGLMHYGFTPPYTGKKEYNPHWFQIDPQLINEIWAYTAPGMPKYAAGISDWAARITSDDWAVSPTVVYGAMYSEAFFQSDIPTLIRHAKEYLPKKDRFRAIIDECLDLWEKNPTDWKPARKVMADKLYFNEDDLSKSIWNADLNGAMGILSLLYGEGDIDKTLLIGCAMGFDCDNQTATMCGLLGVINGVGNVPMDRAMPEAFPHWTKPFNDRYINVTRYDMPDASIEDIIERTVVLAEKNILARGGSVREKNGEKIYTINPKAVFKPAKEAGATFELPKDRGRNLAPEAAEILALTRETDRSTLDSCWLTIPVSYRAYTVDVINDGVVGGPGAAFYSLGSKSNAPKQDYFGYRWDKPVTTDMISFHYGPLEEFGGWYSNLHAEYLDDAGNWVPLEATVTPDWPFSDEVFFQPHNGEFIFSFPKVTTTAVRVIGDDAVLIHWNKYTKDVSAFISITELQVYEAK
ncbi:MAG: ADP-ribosylglycohydrolase family protein [Bacteroidales bacterium]|nr:ADP-ribosylglycohydrolase family protein [Bacteroidales bacterium]